MNKGMSLWKEAKNIIPGGNQLLSKRSEMFLPELWPSYYSKAKGCEIWDLENNHYYDFASLGVGTCVLGYADDDVNKKVKAAIDSGSMATLNSYEEVGLAKELLQLHPWAQMARFARTGGEACAVAIRIARSATKRDRVAFCGYHGWHDWYLSANLGNSENLDGQLLPGLEPRGVPRALKETNIPFHYNNLKELEEIMRQYQGEIGAIIMEPVRDTEPQEGFLQGVRDIATKYGAVLIFDEVTSGLRVTLGGAHLFYGIMPDMAVFGKALGNGYPISAVIGRKNIMDAAQESFISSTLWTERIGYTAALATFEKMRRLNVIQKLVEYGSMIGAGWERIAQKAGIKVKTCGLKPLIHLKFEYPQALAMQTFYTQEMLEKGFLVSGVAFTTYAYTPEIIEKFLKATEEVFVKIGNCICQGEDIRRYLKGPVKHSGFKRLT